MITIILASAFKGTKQQFAKALTICLCIDSLLIISLIQ